MKLLSLDYTHQLDFVRYFILLNPRTGQKLNSDKNNFTLFIGINSFYKY